MRASPIGELPAEGVSGDTGQVRRTERPETAPLRQIVNRRMLASPRGGKANRCRLLSSAELGREWSWALWPYELNASWPSSPTAGRKGDLVMSRAERAQRVAIVGAGIFGVTAPSRFPESRLNVACAFRVGRSSDGMASRKVQARYSPAVTRLARPVLAGDQLDRRIDAVVHAEREL